MLRDGGNPAVSIPARTSFRAEIRLGKSQRAEKQHAFPPSVFHTILILFLLHTIALARAAVSRLRAASAASIVAAKKNRAASESRFAARQSGFSNAGRRRKSDDLRNYCLSITAAECWPRGRLPPHPPATGWPAPRPHGPCAAGIRTCGSDRCRRRWSAAAPR